MKNAYESAMATANTFKRNRQQFMEALKKELEEAAEIAVQSSTASGEISDMWAKLPSIPSQYEAFKQNLTTLGWEVINNDGHAVLRPTPDVFEVYNKVLDKT